MLLALPMAFSLGTRTRYERYREGVNAAIGGPHVDAVEVHVEGRLGDGRRSGGHDHLPLVGAGGSAELVHLAVVTPDVEVVRAVIDRGRHGRRLPRRRL